MPPSLPPPASRAAETAASADRDGSHSAPSLHTIRRHRVLTDRGRLLIYPFALVACLQTLGRSGEWQSPSLEGIKKASRELPSSAPDPSSATTKAPSDRHIGCNGRLRVAMLRCPVKKRTCRTRA